MEGKVITSSDKKIIFIESTGISFQFNNNVTHTFVWRGKESLHLKFLNLIDGNIKDHQIFNINFLEHFSECNYIYKSWIDLYQLSNFYESTSMEVFSLVMKTFRIYPFCQASLPNLHFFRDRLSHRFPLTSEPLQEGKIGEKVHFAIKRVKEDLPAPIQKLGDLAKIICSEGFAENIKTERIFLAGRELSLRSIKRESIRCLVYLCYLLEEKDILDKIKSFLVRAIRTRVKEVEKIFEKYSKYDRCPALDRKILVC